MKRFSARELPCLIFNFLIRSPFKALKRSHRVQVEAVPHESLSLEEYFDSYLSAGDQAPSSVRSNNFDPPVPPILLRGPSSKTALPSYLRPLEEIGAYISWGKVLPSVCPGKSTKYCRGIAKYHCREKKQSRRRITE